MRNHIQLLVQDSWRGGLLKLLALAARVLFFVIVVPRLSGGELSGYVFANSVAMLGATLLILGLYDELPRVIGGSTAKARGYLRIYLAFSFLAALCGITLIYFRSIAVAIAFLLLATLAGRLFAGMVRSLDAGIDERIQNLPWVLFAFVTLAFDLNQAMQLVAVMAISLIAVQWVSLFIFLRESSHVEVTPPISFAKLITHAISHGLSRLLSNLFFLSILRGPILLPVWFGIEGDLDQVAFAMMIGEMVSQFGTIPGNRAFSRWCRTEPHGREVFNAAIVSSVILGVALYIVSSIVFLLLWKSLLLPPQAQNIALQLQALAFYSLVPVFFYLRFLAWSRNILSFWISNLTFLLLIISTAVVYFVSIQLWFATLAVILLMGFLSLAIRAKSFF